MGVILALCAHSQIQVLFSRLHKMATNDISTILGSTREVMYGEHREHDRMHNIESVTGMICMFIFKKT